MSEMPFFMRFVERQDEQTTPESEEAVRTGVKAGADDRKGRKEWEKQPETMKYPSDGDDDPWGYEGW